MSLALREKDQAHVFRRGHNGGFEVLKAEAEAFMASVLAQLGETTESMKKLIAAKCTDDKFAALLEKLLPVHARPVTAGTSTTAAKAHATRMATDWGQTLRDHGALYKGAHSRVCTANCHPCRSEDLVGRVELCYGLG